jgi:hypothetical protein
MSQVYRIEWVPGSDRLRGTCHCGATVEADDPVAMWEWLLAHPAHPVPAAHPGRPARPDARPWTS